MMSHDIGSNPIHFLLFFIINCFVLISTQSETYANRKQQCTKSYLCHPTDPSLFLQCVPLVGFVNMKCPKGLLFNSVIKTCDWPQNSDCALKVNRGSTPNSLGAETSPTLTSRESPKTEMPDWTTVKTTEISPATQNSLGAETSPTLTSRESPKTGMLDLATIKTGMLDLATIKTGMLDLPTIKTATTTKAETCNSNSCKLPNCKCPDDSIPGSLKVETIPQIVLITFHAPVHAYNMEFFQRLQRATTKLNGCPTGFTFFVSDDNTDFQLVKKLYRQGNEIASLSKTPYLPTLWWREASYENLEDEMVGSRDLISKRSSIPMEKIKGTRLPFIQLDGDDLYQVIKDNNLLWDSSMVARMYNESIWPFTLDYRVTFKQCDIERCPKRSFPGLWEVPLIQWSDMPDENKKPKTYDDMYDAFVDKFEVHYKTNRAPFGIVISDEWLWDKEFHFKALLQFLHDVSQMEDVWVIPVSQAIDWVRNPKPMSLLTEIPSWNCSQYNRK